MEAKFEPKILLIHFTAFHVQYKLQLLSKTCGTPRDGNLPTLHFVFEVISILARFYFENLSALNFVFLYFGCLMTRNDYFLDWIFESFQSLLVPCVGLSIIWHLQTDKLRGLSRELVTTPPTYYQVWWTFIILILWSEFSESESPICHFLTLLVSRVDLFQDNNCPLYAKQTPDTLEMF